MIVADASALLEVLLRTHAAPAIEGRLLSSRQALNAPHLIDVEVAQVLRRYAAIGVLDEARGRELLSNFADLPIRRHPHQILLPRIWMLRHNLTAYDATYVALAEALGAPLLTHDRRLAGSSGHHALIELV
jgi:predicted nucleic acid-binding protein